MIETKGPIEIIGPKCISLQGGMAGVYVKTTGQTGEAEFVISDTRGNCKVIKFSVQ